MSAEAGRHMLFVYGTLRPRCRHPMAEFLARRGNYRGAAKVAGQLYDLGRYPAAVASSAHEEWVYGDLYDIDGSTLTELDHYEAVESPGTSFFGRRLGNVTVEDGASVGAWIYWFHGSLPVNATRIASGQYEKIFPQ